MLTLTNKDLLLLIIPAILHGALAGWFAKKNLNASFYLWFFLGFMFGIFSWAALFYLRYLKKNNMERLQSSPVLAAISNTTVQVKAPEIKNESKPLPMILKEWYYLTPDEETVGPLSFQALKYALLEEEISKDSLVWNEDLSNWTKLETLDDYLELLEN